MEIDVEYMTDDHQIVRLLQSTWPPADSWTLRVMTSEY